MLNIETTQTIGAGERPARVLVVSDDPLIVQMLTIALTYEHCEVSVARDDSAALQQAGRIKPDLVILDRTLPGSDGGAACRRLRAAGAEAILMLLPRGADTAPVAGLATGADDHLIKPFSLPVLLGRGKAVLRGKGINLQSTLVAGNLTLDRLTRKVVRGAHPIELTPREFDLLEMFMSYPCQVFSRRAIITRIWGYDFVGDTNIVDVYIRYLREKLDDADRTLIRSVRGVGYALEPES